MSKEMSLFYQCCILKKKKKKKEKEKENNNNNKQTNKQKTNKTKQKTNKQTKNKKKKKRFSVIFSSMVSYRTVMSPFLYQQMLQNSLCISYMCESISYMYEIRWKVRLIAMVQMLYI